MFTIYADETTGAISNYQEHSGVEPNTDPTPSGKIKLCFPYMPQGFLNGNFQVAMKVNIESVKLEYLNPIKIPDPLPNWPGTETISQPDQVVL